MKKMTFVGDILCQMSMLEANKTTDGYDFNNIFKGVKALFATSDFVGGNLETPITDDVSELTCEQYQFCSPLAFVQAVKEAGFNFVSTANNHCLDRGIQGIDKTVRCLNRINIPHTGVFEKQEKPLSILQVGELKIGLLSYTYGTNYFHNGVKLEKKHRYKVNMFQNQELDNIVDRYIHYRGGMRSGRLLAKIVRKLCPSRYGVYCFERTQRNHYWMKQLKKDISELKNQKVDLLIAFMHIGGQLRLQAMPYTKKMSKWLLRHGVNIVVGAHEHLVQNGVFNQIHNNKIATYCLGNFVAEDDVYQEKPEGYKSEYSIAWHVYVDDETKCILKSSFSILKTIPDEQSYVKVVPCFDLYSQLTDSDAKAQLWDDMLLTAQRFCSKDIVAAGVQAEYEI